MKKKLLVPLPFLLCLALNAFAQELLEAPLSLAPGYSVFHPGVGGISVEAGDSPFRLEVKGIPKNLKNITRHQFRIDEKQFFYQLYSSKKISKELYDQWMSFIKYAPNEKELSKTPLRVSVYILVGENEAGNKVWLADTDTDLDFSDEQARPLLMYTMPLDFQKYKSFADNAVHIKHQRLRDGKVVEEVFPLAVVGIPDDAQVYFNFPRHYSATIKANEEVYQVAIESGSFVSLGLSEENNALVVLTDEVKNKTVDLSVPVQPNQYFYLGNVVYQYLGVDKLKNVARFKLVRDVSTVQSAQVGFTTPDFKGKDYKTGKRVAM